MPFSGHPAPGPSIPTRSQAAAIVTEASNDPGWGMFVWLAVSAGARCAELCDLRWDDVGWDTGVLTIRSGSGEQRPVVLGAPTIALLRAYFSHCAAQAAILGVARRPGAYVFSPSPDGGLATEPDSAAERYARMCAGLGWNMDLDRLPRYSAAELFAAGVDERAFQWRLQRGLSRIQRRPKA